MPPSPSSSIRRDARPSPTVSVVIPARNDESNLPLVLEGLPAVDEIIVVDAGSADDTVAVAREVRPEAVVVRQTRSGKGNALVCGFAASTGDIVVTLNADGSTDPGEIPRFVAALRAGAEVAHGSRYRDGGGDLAARRLERIGNATLVRLVNALFGTRFTDLGSGYNAYWRSCLAALDLPDPDRPGPRRGRPAWGDGAEIEPLLTTRMAARGIRVVEVATTGYPRIHGAEHGGLHQVWRAFRALISESFRRRRPDRTTRTSGRHDPPRHAPAVRPAIPAPAPRLVGERTTGRHAAERLAGRGTASSEPGAHRSRDIDEYDTGGHRTGIRRSGIYDTGVHHIDSERITLSDTGVHRTGVYDSAARRSGLYDTGVHRVGIYDSGLHRVDVYDSGAHHLPEDEDNPLYRQTAPREVGGGRRRLDARDRRAEGRPDLTVIPGAGRADEDAGADPGSQRRPSHLRALPGERFTR